MTNNSNTNNRRTASTLGSYVVASAAVLSLAAAALGSTGATEVPGKSGVRVVDPPNNVTVGHGRNIPIGVRFTQESKKAGVRAVVVRLFETGSHRRQVGKITYRPGDARVNRGALSALSSGEFIVSYQVLTGPDAVHGAKHKTDFPVIAQ